MEIDRAYEWSEWQYPGVEAFGLALGKEATSRTNRILQECLKEAFENFARATTWQASNGRLALWADSSSLFGDKLPVRVTIDPDEFETAIKSELSSELNDDGLAQIEWAIDRWHAALDRCDNAIKVSRRLKDIHT